MSKKSPSLALVAVCRVAYGLYSSVLGLLTNGAVFVWDFGLFISNIVRPNLPAQGVVPHGCAGARGIWPQFVPPQDGDSRCSCPALNAMANHGACSFKFQLAKFRWPLLFRVPSFVEASVYP